MSGKGKGKGAATENSRRRQDNEALAPPALLDDRGKVVVEPENQAVARDKQALAKILSGLPELSKASLTTVITTFKATGTCGDRRAPKHVSPGSGEAY